MRKCIISLFTITVLFNLIACSPTLAKTIYPDAIEHQIKEQLKEKPDFDSSKPVEIVKMVKTPKKHYYIVLFTYSPYYTKHLGDAIFKKEKGNYTFVGGMASTSEKLNNTTMYIDEVPYNVVYGSNEGNRIKTLKIATLDKKSSYTAQIKKGAYFVHFKMFPHNTDLEKVNPFYIMDCYDIGNKQIPWNECVE
ncbi:hypothetical protein COK90_11535 [Priestia megaterium]|uniref:hypothetical protein n=1 Tax=Priestia megaterium TaxID=1404 RepID=UPI000BF9F112|nr:hypothetical protein [Priestia megaterium]PFU61796.1 hypothetical protein COK90_11535 [Priestia megaterium]